MRLLLDTHTWLWWISNPERLSDSTKTLIGDESTDVFFSAVSGWKIAIKYTLGRIQISEKPALFIPPRLARDSIAVLPIGLAHALKAGELPSHHKDPFDRLLIAQAQIEGLTLVSSDSVFPKYEVKLLGA